MSEKVSSGTVNPKQTNGNGKLYVSEIFLNKTEKMYNRSNGVFITLNAQIYVVNEQIQ